MPEIIAPLKSKDTVEEFIKTTSAPYIAAQEGLFLHRKTHLGTALIRQYDMPSSLGKVGNKEGMFFWDANAIPAQLCAQIVDFFKRIYDKYGTEAEVILTANYETNEWRAYIPTQKVTGVSVDSVFNPEHIARKHLIVGTMHSHCNMGAFHSGTDISDASDLDGIHFTIGKLGSETPEIAVMVMINGVQFNYKPDFVADFSEIGKHKAPEWWDGYIGLPGKKPIGEDLFEKFAPVKRIEPKKPVVTFSPSKVYDYRQFQRPIEKSDYRGWGYDDDLWDSYWEVQQATIEKRLEAQTTKDADDAAIMKILNSQSTILSLMIKSDLLNDDDVADLAKDQSTSACRTLLLRKLNRVANLLDDLGLKVVYKLETKKYDGQSRSLV